ncbi:MAG: hypothetical protein JWL77_2308 [Chthonomonadaceae bacterium]|nr:hypothetical protein [Chthonomonadaceae bacterium]
MAGACLLAGAARADRVVLGPSAETLTPNTGKAQFLLGTDPAEANRLWLSYSSPAGIELELERLDLHTETKKRYSFNIEYPILPDFGAAPAIAIGVRDLTGTGIEHGGLYAVATHSFPLSERIYRVMRSFKASGGIGTGSIGGPFAGLEARFGTDLGVYAELYRHRPNVGISLRLARHLEANAATLDGSVYYGLSYTLTR